MIYSDRATRLLRDLAVRHQLSGPEPGTGKPELVVACGDRIRIFGWEQWPKVRFDWQVEGGPAGTALTSMAVVETPAGVKIACASRSGAWYVYDGQGRLVRQQTFAPHRLWHITSGVLQGRRFWFASCTDRTIRIFSVLGELVCTVDAPGRLLTLEARGVDGRLKLAGGVQGRPEVYLFDLPGLIARREAVLRGGRGPAFAARFLELGGEPWIAHSCFDGHAYLYRWQEQARSRLLAPALELQASSPLYALLGTKIGRWPHLLARTERGEILGWDLDELENHASPELVLTCPGRRVKHLAEYSIGGRPVLVAGCGDGSVCVFHLDQIQDGRPAVVIDAGGGEICGIGLCSPASR